MRSQVPLSQRSSAVDSSEIPTVIEPSRSKPSSTKNKRHQPQRTTQEIRASIHNFLMEIVKHWSPDAVLEEFKHLFICPVNLANCEARQSLREIIFMDDYQEFQRLLQRSCYILINNWNSTRQHQPIHDLIQLFADPTIAQKTSSPTLKRLRNWLQTFIESQDYQNLKLFATKHEKTSEIPWQHRYASHLLVSQYRNVQNPIEQRKAAKQLSQKLKDRFKFELAMYTAHSQRRTLRDQMLRNPTELGEGVMGLIERVVKKRGFFSHTNLANIFKQQTQGLSYQSFKQSLQKYLVFSVKNQGFGKALQDKLTEKLAALYPERDRETLNEAILLRTCNRLIGYFTTESGGKPSQLFISLLTQGNALTLATILLKLVLICNHARTHLDTCIAKLIQYYESYPEAECQWLIRFLEVYNVVFTIHVENVQYNLVNMKDDPLGTQPIPDPDIHRIFSQLMA